MTSILTAGIERSAKGLWGRRDRIAKIAQAAFDDAGQDDGKPGLVWRMHDRWRAALLAAPAYGFDDMHAKISTLAIPMSIGIDAPEDDATEQYLIASHLRESLGDALRILGGMVEDLEGGRPVRMVPSASEPA